jgi:hypothetical protein
MIGNQVTEAFKRLEDELRLVATELRRLIQKASTSADIAEIKAIIADAESVEELAKEVREISSKWSGITAGVRQRYPEAVTTRGRRPSGEADVKGATKRYFPRLPRGLKTPEHEFRRPILEVLEEMGGSAPMHDVLDALEKRLQSRFTEADLQTLPYSRDVRWRNTAQWAKHDLVKDGFTERPRRRGLWEIPEKGRRWLAERRSSKHANGPQA